MSRTGNCESCGKRGPVLDVSYRQNTGMLLVRQSRVVAGALCRSCSGHIFAKMTLHTFVLGWWGMISMIVTPIFLINNLYFGIQTLFLPTAAKVARSALEDQREYAVNLLATKDRATVVEVLASTTGVPSAEVDAFVSRVEAERPRPTA